MSATTKVRVTGDGPVCPNCGAKTVAIEVIEDSPPEAFTGDKGYYCPTECYKKD